MANAQYFATGPPAPPLDYHQRPSTRRRLIKRMLRWWPAYLGLLAVGLGVACGPRLLERSKLLSLQEACMTAELPQDRPVFETNPESARSLVAAYPAEYRLQNASAIRADNRWLKLLTQLGINPKPGRWTGFPFETDFLHERFTPSGARRLVVIENLGMAVLVEPRGWFRRPRVIDFRAIEFDERSARLWQRAKNGRTLTRISAGTPDPTDGSRFTISETLGDITGTWEYRLTDDDHITGRLLDTEEFTRKAGAAAKTAVPNTRKTSP